MVINYPPQQLQPQGLTTQSHSVQVHSVKFFIGIRFNDNLSVLMNRIHFLRRKNFEKMHFYLTSAGIFLFMSTLALAFRICGKAAFFKVFIQLRATSLYS